MVRGPTRSFARWMVAALLAASVPFAMGLKCGRTVAWRTPTRPASQPATVVSWPEEPVDICLSTRIRNHLGRDYRIAVEVQGTLLGLGTIDPVSAHDGFPHPLVFCDQDPNRYIDVQDADRETWRILYNVSRYPMPQPRVSLGARVRFTMEGHLGGPARSLGFVLRDDEGPVVAVDEEGFGFLPEDQRPLRVTWGPGSRVQRVPCGDQVQHPLHIPADQPVEVLQGDTLPLTIGGVPYRIHDVASYEWEDVDCLHTFNRISWFLWRE